MNIKKILIKDILGFLKIRKPGISEKKLSEIERQLKFFRKEHVEFLEFFIKHFQDFDLEIDLLFCKLTIYIKKTEDNLMFFEVLWIPYIK